jgi:retron-type reverse transcriptase
MVVSPTQAAFIRGQNVLEGSDSSWNNTWTTSKKQSRVILKLDFEKAYDKVMWPFLLQTLWMKGFSSKLISWIKSFISGGSVAVNVNDDVGHYFQTKKGLRQGGPLSPLLFNIMVDMLKVFIGRAKANGQWEGVIPHLVDGGLWILRYADNTILFMDHDLDKARNMKLLLFAFEQAPGLNINFHKSELFCFGAA